MANNNNNIRSGDVQQQQPYHQSPEPVQVMHNFLQNFFWFQTGFRCNRVCFLCHIFNTDFVCLAKVLFFLYRLIQRFESTLVFFWHTDFVI